MDLDKRNLDSGQRVPDRDAGVGVRPGVEHHAIGPAAGIVQRIESALSQFPDRAGTEENYIRLAQAYADEGDGPATKRSLERCLAAHPEGERNVEVRSWLDALATPPAPPAGDDTADADESDDEDTPSDEDEAID